VAQEEDEEGLRELEEVIVSARKREENSQDIPQAVLAFNPRDIGKIGIRNMRDLARFVPSMTVVGDGGLSNKVVFRGLADSISPFIVESSAAVYLDEQPLTTGAKTPDIRPVEHALRRQFPVGNPALHCRQA
jgi:outer membrane receptor protein involved in Fe transport